MVPGERLARDHVGTIGGAGADESDVVAVCQRLAEQLHAIASAAPRLTTDAIGDRIPEWHDLARRSIGGTGVERRGWLGLHGRLGLHGWLRFHRLRAAAASTGGRLHA